MSQDKKILTKEQAKEVLALDENDMVHTFYNAPFGLIGADHSKKSIYKDIDCAERLEITGEQAQSMCHGLAVIPKGAKKQSDILFVETNMEVLKKYDKN